MSPASYLTAPPRVAAGSIAPLARASARLAPDVRAERAQDRLHLEDREPWVLLADPRDDPGDVRRRHAVPRHLRDDAALPRRRDVDPEGAELRRRRRVVVEEV